MSFITPGDVTKICASQLSESAIEQLICVVEGAMLECVQASYPNECTQKTIIAFAVCHLVESASGGNVKSKKAANGAAITYDNGNTGTGLNSTNAGRTLAMIDIHGCSNALFADDIDIFSAGNPAKPRY